MRTSLTRTQTGRTEKSSPLIPIDPPHQNERRLFDETS